MKSLSLAFVFIFISFKTYADEAPAPITMPESCKAFIQNFCADKKTPRDTLKCLAENSKSLDDTCKKEIERSIQMLSDASERGGGALTSFGGLNAMGPPIPLFSYEGTAFSGKDSIPMSEHKVNLSAPLYKGDGYSLGGSLAGGQLHLGDGIKLDSGKELPAELYRYEIGFQYFQPLSDKRMLGVRASAGYSGDKPSSAGKDLSYSLNMFYGFPGEGNGYWMLMVFMANNSPLVNYLPIPGVVYLYRTPTFTGMFGFPILSMQWTPAGALSYSLSLFGLTLQSEVAYGARDQYQIFTGYSFNRQSYILSDRIEEKDRLSIQDQKVALGFRFPIKKKAEIEFKAGRSFDRSIYIGNGFNDKSKGLTTVESDSFANLSLKFAF